MITSCEPSNFSPATSGPADPAPYGDVANGVAFDGGEYPAEAAVNSILLTMGDLVVAHHMAADILFGPATAAIAAKREGRSVILVNQIS